MGRIKRPKTKEERVQEGISILKQMLEAGVKEHLGFRELKEKISAWVESGEAWDGVISFAEHGRVAEVSLPKYNNRAAGVNFKVIRH
jgi:hypothetical protein